MNEVCMHLEETLLLPRCLHVTVRQLQTCVPKGMNHVMGHVPTPVIFTHALTYIVWSIEYRPGGDGLTGPCSHAVLRLPVRLHKIHDSYGMQLGNESPCFTTHDV